MTISKFPKVIFIGTGGSISTIGRDSLDLSEYGDYGYRVEPAELLDRFPEVSRFAQVECVPFRTLRSTDVTVRDWLDLVRTIHASAAGSAGVVITHGTASLEETAYFLNLTLQIDQPVVLVGAQRPPTGLSSDSGLNLVNAVRVAADSQSRGLGVLAVLNDEVHAAREVTKADTYRLHAFCSPVFGPLGVADPDRVVFRRSVTQAHYPGTPFDVTGATELPRVDVAYSYLGSDGTAIRALVGAGAKAVVVATMAPGRPTPAETDAIREAVSEGVFVVLSCRAGHGRVLDIAATRELGVVVAEDLNPQKARILAMLACHAGADRAQLQNWMSYF